MLAMRSWGEREIRLYSTNRDAINPQQFENWHERWRWSHTDKSITFICFLVLCITLTFLISYIFVEKSDWKIIINAKCKHVSSIFLIWKVCCRFPAVLILCGNYEIQFDDIAETVIKMKFGICLIWINRWIAFIVQNVTWSTLNRINFGVLKIECKPSIADSFWHHAQNMNAAQMGQSRTNPFDRSNRIPNSLKSICEAVCAH